MNVALNEGVDLQALKNRVEAAGGKFQLLSMRGPGDGPLVKLSFPTEEEARKFSSTMAGLIQEGKKGKGKSDWWSTKQAELKGKGKEKLSNCGAPPEGETSKGAGRCGKCKDGAMFECKVGDTVSGHGDDWKVEMLLQNGGLVARNINDGNLRKFSAEEAEQFTKVLGAFGEPEDVPPIDPGNDLSPLEQYAELMTPDQLDAFISGGHDLSKVPPRRGNPRRGNPRRGNPRRPRLEHCGHCPEDFAKWVKRFPEDDDASYQARLEKAADVGFEGMEDEELTPAGLQRKRAVYREGHYEGVKGLIQKMIPEVEDGFAGGDMFVDFVRNQVVAGYLELQEQGRMPSEEDWQIVSQYIGPEAVKKLAALKSRDENAISEIIQDAQDFYGKIREAWEDDEYETLPGDEDDGGEQAQYGPGDDIDVEVGDRVDSTYGKLWITGTGVVGDLWTSHDRGDVESGRGRGMRFGYVKAVQKQGRGPWYQVHYDRDSDTYTVKTNILDVVTLRDQNNNPITFREDPNWDAALNAARPEGATNAYFLDVGNDDGALIAFTRGPVSPGEIVQALSGPEYGIEVSPAQVHVLESHGWGEKPRNPVLEPRRLDPPWKEQNRRTSVKYLKGRIKKFKTKDPLKAAGYDGYEKDLKAFEAEWTDDEDYKRKQGDWAPDEQPGASDPMGDYPNINRRGLTPEKVVRIDSFGDVDYGAEDYREDDPKYDGSNPENYPAVVSLYDVTRELGGHEEGGWWYDWRTLVQSVPVKSPEEAQAAARQLFGLIPQADLDGKPEIALERTEGAMEKAQRPRYESVKRLKETDLAAWTQRHGGTDSLSAGFDFPLEYGQTVTVTQGFRSNRGYLKPGTTLTFVGLGAYSVLFKNEHDKFVRLSHEQLRHIQPTEVSESVEALVRKLLGESTVEMTVSRVDPVTDQDLDIPVEVELDLIPGSRGARDSLGGRRGAGPPLEPDEPATAEVTSVTVLDDELAVKFPNFELTPDEEERAIEQAIEQAADIW